MATQFRSLEAGVQLLPRPPRRTIETPLLLTYGTATAVPFGRGAQHYANGAVVPSPIDRMPTAEERRALSEPKDPLLWIKIVRLPDAVMGPFRVVFAGLREPADKAKLPAIITSEEFKAAAQSVHDHLTSRGADLDRRYGGVYCEPGDKTTVTINRATGDHIGLHLDSFYAKTIASRRLCPTRISINVGSKTRRLLFVNLPIDEITKRVGADGNERETEPLIKSFFASNPEYPVVSMPVEPGEAYIAPTEAIIHDGQYYGDGLDITYTVMGNFPKDI